MAQRRADLYRGAQQNSRARLAGRVDLVHLVCLVHLVGLVQPNKRDKPNKPNNGLLMLADFFSLLLVWRDCCGIQFQQAVVAVGHMFDCEEAIANVDGARHHAAVDKKNKVPVRGVLEEPTYDG